MKRKWQVESTLRTPGGLEPNPSRRPSAAMTRTGDRSSSGGVRCIWRRTGVGGNVMTPNLKALHLKQAVLRDRQRARFDELHAILHEVMRDFDRAILIHEVLAEVEGRDPQAVSH